MLLDARGERLAGPEALVAPARALLRDAPAELEARTDAGAVFAARDDDRQLVVVTGPLALPGLTRHDLRTVLRALGGAEIRVGREIAPIDPPREAVEALLEVAPWSSLRPFSASQSRLRSTISAPKSSQNAVFSRADPQTASGAAVSFGPSHHPLRDSQEDA